MYAYLYKMNTFSLPFLMLSFLMLHQSYGGKHWERYIDWIPKDTLACYSDRTIGLFENLKQVVKTYCVQDGENEFKTKIVTRSGFYKIIAKEDGELFENGKKQAEEIALKVITKVHRCLSYDCSSEKQEKVNEFIQTFRRQITWCGDSEFLAKAVATLATTCEEEKKKGISNDSDIKSLFARNGVNDMSDWWARK
ncbi:uncharacterized protein LOC135848002 [Planococcus citri]|uniref:uncharacterized protein LOC135848002 n=1 Tax=Planococcus citri TaxID=170843 RepID=UPI0031F96C55